MNVKQRGIALGVILVLSATGAAGYVWKSRQDQVRTAAGEPAVAAGGDLSTLRAAPHLVFRSTALGEGYGQVAVVPLTAPGGPRAFTGVTCERVYATDEVREKELKAWKQKYQEYCT